MSGQPDSRCPGYRTTVRLAPPAYAADAVLRFEDAAGRPLVQVVLEVQLGIDPDKIFSWPLYGVGLRARDREPVVVVVVAPDAAVAAWCAQPITLDPVGNVYRTVVLGPEAIPRITDPDAARASPALAVLSAVAHGKEDGAEHIAMAALAGCDVLDSPKDSLYADLVRASLSETAQRVLEVVMDMSKYEPLSEFYRKPFLEGRKSVLLEQLELRFGAVSAELAARVQAADSGQVRQWTRRILTAPTLEAMFAEEPAEAGPASG